MPHRLICQNEQIGIRYKLLFALQFEKWMGKVETYKRRNCEKKWKTHKETLLGWKIKFADWNHKKSKAVKWQKANRCF